MKKLVICLVIAVLACAPFAVDKPEAVDACTLAAYAPEGLRGALTAVCWYILIELPDPGELPDDTVQW